MACTPRPLNAPRFIPLWMYLFGFLFFLFSSPPAGAQAPQVNPSDHSGSTEAIETALQNLLEGERSTLEEMEQNLARWKALRESVTEEIESFRIQDAFHANLLLVAQPRAVDLEAALNSDRLMAKSLQERIERFEEIGSIAADRMARIADRIAIAEKQRKDLRREGLADSKKATLQEKVDLFLDLLREKQNQGRRFLQSYDDLFDRLKQLMSDLNETRRQLEDRLQARAGSDLFARSSGPFAKWHGWQADWTAIQKRTKTFLPRIFGVYSGSTPNGALTSPRPCSWHCSSLR